ncbi:hypothetical protein FB567DRAFT_594921 [Paraphoma chrysanthemicola]|uniref:Uncharacterized protein n=1 Tax=Paraphoma chrysanthemicola TaxID=798071 RepID=A0A8K0VW03_9PLEO|nr:hypothetical protein FB567DRAFT_594921 [Paraphoma chrysanthemicola]
MQRRLQRPSPIFHRWANLPTDLKLQILDAILVKNRIRGMKPPLHRYYTQTTGIVSLLCASKEMRDLAYRSYYRHGVVLVRGEMGKDDRKPMLLPSLGAAIYVPRVEVHLYTEYRCKNGASSEYDYRYELVEFLESSHRLVRFTNMSSLKIVWEVNYNCLKHVDGWWNRLEKLTGPFPVPFVLVVIQGFRCDGTKGNGPACPHDCTARVAKALEKLFGSSSSGRLAIGYRDNH